MIDVYALKFKEKTQAIVRKWRDFEDTVRPHTMFTLENAKNEVKSLQKKANISKGVSLGVKVAGGAASTTGCILGCATVAAGPAAPIVGIVGLGVLIVGAIVKEGSGHSYQKEI